MTILPGSLDYLYYNGVLDHIPYEAYSMPAPTMNGTQYLDMAKQGQIYNAYNHRADAFIRRNTAPIKEGYSIKDHAFSDGRGVGEYVDYERMANGEEGKKIRRGIKDKFACLGEKFSEMTGWQKGLLGAGVLGLVLCVVCKKRPKI